MLFITILGSISYLILLFFIPESPVWLFTKGRDEEAINSLNYIASFNLSKNRIGKARFAESIIGSQDDCDEFTRLKDKLTVKRYIKTSTFILLNIVYTNIGIVSWMTYYLMSA